MATKHSRRDAAESDNVLIELHLMFGKLESDKQSQVVEVSTSLLSRSSRTLPQRVILVKE